MWALNLIIQRSFEEIQLHIDEVIQLRFICDAAVKAGQRCIFIFEGLFFKLLEWGQDIATTVTFTYKAEYVEINTHPVVLNDSI